MAIKENMAHHKTVMYPGLPHGFGRWDDEVFTARTAGISAGYGSILAIYAGEVTIERLYDFTPGTFESWQEARSYVRWVMMEEYYKLAQATKDPALL